MIAKMTSISGRINVEKFSSTNFQMWKLKMEDLLNDRDIWDAIDDNKLRHVDLTFAAQYDVTDRKGKGLIRLCLEILILINVHKEPIVKKF